MSATQPAGFTSTPANVVERAADRADEAIRATQRATSAALDNVADKVHHLRDRASPVVDRVTAPFDSVANYTQQAPLKSLLAAAAAGAVLLALVSLLTRRRD